MQFLAVTMTKAKSWPQCHDEYENHDEYERQQPWVARCHAVCSDVGVSRIVGFRHIMHRTIRKSEMKREENTVGLRTLKHVGETVTQTESVWGNRHPD